jgi:catechol 2,3-dioxygenase-like lactoylglutathione lyase family enzyme
MSDVGLTHVALSVSKLEESIAFYAAYARMKVVHQRADGPIRVAWMTDNNRRFVIVLAEMAAQRDAPLAPFGHIGIGCESRADLDRLCNRARAEGRLKSGPSDDGYPVGYWAYIADPDGNNLEISYGQEIGLTLSDSR